MKKLSLLLPLSLLACGDGVDPQVKAAEDAVKYVLKDPQSAQFRNVRVLEVVESGSIKSPVVCGEVNSKNSYGGYTGFSPFKYDTKDRSVLVPNEDDEYELEEVADACKGRRLS